MRYKEQIVVIWERFNLRLISKKENKIENEDLMNHLNIK